MNRALSPFLIGLAVCTLSLGVTRLRHAEAHGSDGGTRYSSFRMLGQSMMPTLQNDELVELDRSAYFTRLPRRDDIVVFRATPAGEPNRLFVKRIIALPGETVAVRHTVVYINGHRLAEPYVSSRAQYVFRRHRVPANDYFVLGDNRNNSQDSHLWLGLPRHDIVGKVVLGR